MNADDYEKYLRFIESGELLEAVNLKGENIPTKLYKYYALNDNLEINENKIKFLADNSVYLSKLSDFNDPFEGKYLIFNKDNLEEKGWDIKHIYEYYENMRCFWRATCLCDTNEQNMPMWAYYANSHRGFCVEYLLSDMAKKYILPVCYESQRHYADSIVTRVINSFAKFKYEKIAPDGKEQALLHLIFLSFAVKHSSWKHEKEYRIIGPEEKFPLIASKIYIGLNCEKNYAEKLIDIGKLSSGLCQVYQMELERDSPPFELQKHKIV